eukprot:3792131-Karenia_brevis.AAC.1
MGTLSTGVLLGPDNSLILMNGKMRSSTAMPRILGGLGPLLGQSCTSDLGHPLWAVQAPQ